MVDAIARAAVGKYYDVRTNRVDTVGAAERIMSQTAAAKQPVSKQEAKRLAEKWGGEYVKRFHL